MDRSGVSDKNSNKQSIQNPWNLSDYEYSINKKFLFSICCGKIGLSFIDWWFLILFITLLKMLLTGKISPDQALVIWKVNNYAYKVEFWFVKKVDN